ncbi:hypothetical protein ABW19_dt0207516 [Dactylella cylindrospora]|nr:hypothetical protein ABW19_dt0207516 [Dactylella cylindrospora]
MREHSDFFKLFLSVAPPRRNKKSSASSAATSIPTEDAIDRAFSEHVTRMEKSGVYGDNLEIVAFSRCYDVNVKIYQKEFAYQISCSDDPAEVAGKRLLHIAYHSWEHYSSVRNIDGPHSGLPKVEPKAMTEEGKRRQKEILEQGTVILPWMEKVVEASLPGFVRKEKVREMLEKCKGDVNLAVSRLLDEVEEEEEKQAEKEGNKDAQAEVLVNGNGNEKTEKPGGKKSMKEADTKEKEEPAGDTSKQTSVQQASKGKGKGKKGGPAGAGASGAGNGGGGNGAAGKQQPKAQNRPKRETAREKKERQKRENLERKKQKAAGSTGTSSKGGSTSTKVLEEGIKTLHV